MPFLDANNPMVTITNLNVLTLLAAYLATFVTVYVYHRKAKKDMAKENEEKFEKKASVVEMGKLEDYVDQQDRGLHKRVNKLEQNDVDLGKKIDDNHNFLIKLLTDLNTNVMNAISKKHN